MLFRSLYKISKIDFDGLTAKIDTIRLKKDFKWFKSSGNSLCINNIDNSVGVFDLNTLKLIASVDNPIKLNLAYSDKKNNIWLCTVNDGLVLYQKKSIQNKTFSGLTKNKNFLSCAFDAQGSFYAGNDMGEVIESTNSLAKKHSVKSEVVTIWVRKIICSSDKIVAVHDRGVSINFGPSKTIIRNDKNLNSTKSTVKVNDSIILLGTNNGLIKYNIITHDYAHRNSPDIGVTDIIKATDALFYFIGGNSLYQYDYAKNSFSEIVLSKKETQDSPTFLGYDDNNILWVSTITGNILGLKNNKVIKTISNTIGLPENITCLLAVENKLWIGSKSGIFILDTANNTFDKLTTIDGLSTSFINALTLNNKTVFAATTEGITKIPSQIILPKFDIVPQIVALKINNKNTKIASSYDLDSNQNSIFIELAGTELTGHFKNFQYAINTTKEWNVVSENNLSLRLNSGVSTIYIRATNSNNQVGSKMIVLKFDISTVYYKTIWFWILVTFLLLTLLILYVYKRKLENQKITFQQQLALEQQRNKITADLHDDIGATLSSLQLNSSIANQLIKKDLPRAEMLLDKIENQSKDLADKIGDIIWSMKPGKDEFMTMSSRIKNFANDILGATTIDYTININSEIDTMLTDITTRKNIVLIAKETINNIVKYSNAKNVHIAFEKENNSLLLSISDDGIGFNPEIVKGNGITNMKRRAIEINGEFNIISSEKKGTSITLQIQCP